MILNLFDKLIFTSFVILTFQVSILSDHYLQFINGYYQATKLQIDGYQANADKHQYKDVTHMINDLLKNSSSVVRTDAKQKQQTLHEYNELTQAIETLKTGNLLARAWFILQPKRKETLNKVLENFQPSIPVKLNDVIYSLFFAFLLSSFIMLPIRFTCKKLSNFYKKDVVTTH